MKITDVKVTVWEWNDIPPTRYTLNVKSSGTRSTHMALVKIITDEGIEGHAFLGNALSSLGNDANVIIDRFKPMLVGQDPLAREKIFQRMSTWAMGPILRVIGAIDVALWDLAGKAAGVPIHKLMGSYRESVPAYASSAVFEHTEEYARKLFAIRKPAGARIKYTRQPLLHGTSKFAKQFGARSAMTIASCWIQLGHMIIQTRCGSVERLRHWTFIGTKIRLRTMTSTAT